VRVHRSVLRGGVAVLLAALGCDEVPEVVLPDEVIGETRDLRIRRDESAGPICEGTFTAWQAHVERIGAFMGASRPLGPIDVVVTAQSGVESYCGDTSEGLPGCALVTRRPPVAVGDPWAIPHELAHAVAVLLHGGPSSPFWSEGFAEAWSERGSPLPREPILSAFLANDPLDLSYPAASHWVQWIEREYGVEAVAEILRISKPSDPVEEWVGQFELVFGEPYSALQQRFWREAPLWAPGFARCDDTDVVMPASGRVDFSVDLDCQTDPAPAVNGPGGGLHTARIIEFAERGRYEIIVRSGHWILTACESTDDPFEAERRASEPHGFVPSTGIDARDGLEAGRYKLWLVAPTFQPTELAVTIMPALALTRIVD
jgi:hypothetical protein